MKTNIDQELQEAVEVDIITILILLEASLEVDFQDSSEIPPKIINDFSILFIFFYSFIYRFIIKKIYELK